MRRRPVPARGIGFDPYRLVVATNQTLHIMGPNGRDAVLSAFAEERRNSCTDVAVALRDVRNLQRVINTVLPEVPTVRELMVQDVRRARETYRKYVSLRQGWSLARARNPRDGEFISVPTDAEGYENALTVLALSRFYAFLTQRDEFPDRDPMRMDPERSRLKPGETRRTGKEADGKVVTDTDLLFRTAQAKRIAPRTGDPFFLERIVRALDDVGAPPVVKALIEAKGLSGGRDFQLRPTPLYNWLVLGKGDFIHVAGKYSAGRLVQKLRVSTRLGATLRGLMDVTYERFGGYDGLCRMARSPTRRLELKNLFIFSLDGVRAVSYSFVNDCWFRPAIERAGLCVDDLGDGHGEPVPRWVTQHWLRHEFTNGILERIEASAVSAKDRMVQRILLARYMGWKSAQAMLEFYGRWFFQKEVDVFIAAQMEAANDNSMPACFDEAFDAAGMSEEETAEVRAVMGGLMRRAA